MLRLYSVSLISRSPWVRFRRGQRVYEIKKYYFVLGFTEYCKNARSIWITRKLVNDVRSMNDNNDLLCLSTTFFNWTFLAVRLMVNVVSSSPSTADRQTPNGRGKLRFFYCTAEDCWKFELIVEYELLWNGRSKRALNVEKIMFTVLLLPSCSTIITAITRCAKTRRLPYNIRLL